MLRADHCIVLSLHPGSEGTAKGNLSDLAEAYVPYWGIPSGAAYGCISRGDAVFMCCYSFWGCNGKLEELGRCKGKHIRERAVGNYDFSSDALLYTYVRYALGGIGADPESVSLCGAVRTDLGDISVTRFDGR